MFLAATGQPRCLKAQTHLVAGSTQPGSYTAVHEKLRSTTSCPGIVTRTSSRELGRISHTPVSLSEAASPCQKINRERIHPRAAAASVYFARRRRPLSPRTCRKALAAKSRMRAYVVAIVTSGWTGCHLRPSYLLCWATAQDLAHIITATETLQANGPRSRGTSRSGHDLHVFEHVRFPPLLVVESASSNDRECARQPAPLNLSIDSDSLPGLPFLPAKSPSTAKFTSPKIQIDQSVPHVLRQIDRS